MGGNFSCIEDIDSNPYLYNFTKPEKITESDPCWNQFLSFPLVPKYTKFENNLLKKLLAPFFSNLLENCTKSRNIISFLNVFFIRVEELKGDSQCNYMMSKESIFIKQLYNSMFIIRNVVKCFAESNKLPYMLVTEDQNVEESREIFKKLIYTLMCLSIELPIKDVSYTVHLETVLTLFVILNSAHSTKGSSIQNLIFADECKIHSRAFLKSLLRNITGSYTVMDGENSDEKEHKMEMNKEASSFGSMFWGYVSLGYYSTNKSALKSSLNHLSSHSVFLILRLCIGSHINDEYAKSLFAMHDLSSDSKDLQSEGNRSVTHDTTLEISFSDLLKVFVSNFDEEHIVLLFYLFLYRNTNFRNYILAKESFSDIIIPLIKLIYDFSSDNSNGVYMALIILLILTENNYFNSTVQRENVAYLSWIKEKTITNISVGSLIVWILCRSIQFNLGHIGDRYIHTNCLAALANMSSKFSNLHPQASEQIMVLLNLLMKRKTVITNSLKSKPASQEGSEEICNLNTNLSIVEEVLQMMVEIVNTALIFSLANNSHMIHTFLYHRKQFVLLKQFPSVQTHACNIEAILTYFSTKIDKEMGKVVSSQNDVLRIINNYSPQINKLNNFKRFPELRFKYIEEESAEEFFVPYIWNILSRSSLLYSEHKSDPTTSDCKC